MIVERSSVSLDTAQMAAQVVTDGQIVGSHISALPPCQRAQTCLALYLLAVPQELHRYRLDRSTIASTSYDSEFLDQRLRNRAELKAIARSGLTVEF